MATHEERVDAYHYWYMRMQSEQTRLSQEPKLMGFTASQLLRLRQFLDMRDRDFDSVMLELEVYSLPPTTYVDWRVW